MQYKIDFELLPWEYLPGNIIQKRKENSLMKFRKIRLYSGYVSEHCTRAHFGYVIDGNIEIDFESDSIVFQKGDGIEIPGGKNHCHRLKVPEYAELFLMEFTATLWIHLSPIMSMDAMIGRPYSYSPIILAANFLYSPGPKICTHRLS